MHPHGVQPVRKTEKSKSMLVKLMHPHGVQLYRQKVRVKAVLIWCFARTSLSYTLLNSHPLLLPDLDFRSDMFAYTSPYLFLIVLSQHLNYCDKLRSNNAYRTVLLSNCSYYKRFYTGKQALCVKNLCFGKSRL